MKAHDDNYDDDADLDEREWPDESDAGSSDIASVDTQPCPFCNKAVYEKADICPHCRNFISFDETRRHPWWILLAALLALAGVLAWVL